MNARTRRADGLLLLTAMIWGVAFVAQRVGMAHLGPMGFNAVRFALGALVLLPAAAVRRVEDRGAAPVGLLVGGGLAGVMVFSGASLQQMGLVYTTAGKAGFITGLYVVIVPLLGRFVGQPADRTVWLGASLAAAGLYLLSVNEAFRISFGDLLELAGAFFWALHILVLGWLSPRMPAVRLACAQFGVCAVLSAMAALGFETVTVSGLTDAAVPILYGGVISVGVGYTLQVKAQRRTPSSHAAIILSLEAVFAALAGWAILGESLNGRELLGCGLMMAGMLVTQIAPLGR